MTRFALGWSIYGGSAIIEPETGWLVDHGPPESIERIAAALNECDSGDLGWALPAVSALQGVENERVIRALAKRARRAESR